MLTEETNKKLNTSPANPEAEIANEESAPEETGKGNWREAFRAAFDRARRQQKPAESRQELGRDKSKSLFLLVGVCVALLLLFFARLLPPEEKDCASRGEPTRRCKPGPQSYTGTGGHRPHQSGNADAECGCAFYRSRPGWPIDAGRYRPDLANRHGAQANCRESNRKQARAGLCPKQGRFL